MQTGEYLCSAKPEQNQWVKNDGLSRHGKCLPSQFLKLRIYCLEGHSPPVRKYQEGKIMSNPKLSHINPPFMFYFLQAYQYFYHLLQLKQQCLTNQEFVPLHKQKKKIKRLRTTFIATSGFYHQYMVLTAIPSSDCTGSSESRSH